MLLQSLLLINSLLISIADILDLHVSIESILVMFAICSCIQISVGVIDLPAIGLMLLMSWFMRSYLEEADLLIISISSLNMTLERLGIFFICMGFMTLGSFSICKLFGRKHIPFTPHILTSHLISVLSY